MAELKDEKHQLVSDLLRVAAELGKVPCREEYLELGKFSKHQIVSRFGSFSTLVLAAGLNPPKQKKQSKEEINQRSYEKHNSEVQNKEIYCFPPKVYKCIFVWGDRHQPYGHKDTVSFLIACKKKYNPDLVIDIGDGEDVHGMNFHEKDEDLLSAGHELQEAIRINKLLYEEFPEVMACESNHSSLFFRRGKHHGFPRHVLKEYRDILEAPAGWTLHHEIIVQMSNGKKVLFCHGYGSNVLRVSQQRGISTVQGHHHSKQGIQYWANYDGVYFAAQVGCLIDDKSMAFAYNKLTPERPLLGCLIIENGIPKVLPMILDRKGRWTGEVP